MSSTEYLSLSNKVTLRAGLDSPANVQYQTKSIDHCSCLKSMVIAGSSLSQTGVICWYEGQHGEMDMTGGVNQNVSPHWTAADISPSGHTTQHNTTQQNTTQHNTTQHNTGQKITISSTFSCGIFSGTIYLSSINACLVSQR